MDYDTLLEKYNELLAKYYELEEENRKLKEKLDILPDNKWNREVPPQSRNQKINKFSPAAEKIDLFMSLFNGRRDVYAKRWQNRKGKSGYSPVCLNEWVKGICKKPIIKCSQCNFASYAGLDENAIEDHLKGKLTIGIYPMLPDETCNFLAIDFDEDGWQKDISVLREVCSKFEIPAAVERSRSGKGAHAWFFFEEPVLAVSARKFGTGLLTYAMEQRHEIKFKSYDRLFPNQDTMPKGGFGNLIALPLQMEVRKEGNSVFIDENFRPFQDQWQFLGRIERLSEERIKDLISELSKYGDLGQLRHEPLDENGRAERTKPWERRRIELSGDDFPKDIKITKADNLYIDKTGFSSKALNRIKRLAAFKNPEYYRAQAMRLPTYNKPRVISCSDESEDYLILPRCCENDLSNLLNEYNVEFKVDSQYNEGKKIFTDFLGALRNDQASVLDELMKYDTGVLSAATAFGKTVVAASLIAQRKRNTLILVHRKQLLDQWIDRLNDFLKISGSDSAETKNSVDYTIGFIGSGKDKRTGIIDVALLQSLSRKGEVKDFIRNYGMVIVDECHHVPAFSFEQVLKTVNARYVYGLTATPERKDGRHPSIFMYCGPLRYKKDSKTETSKPFEQYIIPRFTGCKVPAEKDEHEVTIQQLYSELINDERRNQLITDDVVNNNDLGRNSLVITERTAHLKVLYEKLSEKIPNVLMLSGNMGAKETAAVHDKIANTSADENLTIVATGKYIGEGFDEPRLDTLFLTMPVSWKGTIKQYAGRLNRVFKGKKEIQIFDYVDVNVNMFERMYNKRLKGYASIGYKTSFGIYDC